MPKGAHAVARLAYGEKLVTHAAYELGMTPYLFNKRLKAWGITPRQSGQFLILSAVQLTDVRKRAEVETALLTTGQAMAVIGVTHHQEFDRLAKQFEWTYQSITRNRLWHADQMHKYAERKHRVSETNNSEVTKMTDDELAAAIQHHVTQMNDAQRQADTHRKALVPLRNEKAYRMFNVGGLK